MTQSVTHVMYLYPSILPMAYGLVVLILFVRKLLSPSVLASVIQHMDRQTMDELTVH